MSKSLLDFQEEHEGQEPLRQPTDAEEAARKAELHALLAEEAALDAEEAAATEDVDWADVFAKAREDQAAITAAREALYDEPVVDTPASTHAGSDSYPAIVTEVVRFKSGPNKGKVRKIMVAGVRYDPEAVVRSCVTGGYGWDKTIDVTHHSVRAGGSLAYTRREKRGSVRWVREGGGDWQSVSLGEARDYRDPHV